MASPIDQPASSPAAAPTQGAGGVWEWLWRPRALETARTSSANLRAGERERLRRARVAAELADRAIDPVDPLRDGSSIPLALSLYREAAYWALLAQDRSLEATDLKQAFAGASDEVLLYAAGSGEELATVRKALVEKSFVQTADDHLDVARRDARVAQALVRALIDRAAARDDQEGNLLLQRWLRTSTLLLILAGAIAAAAIAHRTPRSPDLAQGKPWRASSKYADCQPEQQSCGGARTAILFHTLEEQNPWFEIDLGAPKKFSVVEVGNREDCCPDRAIPLIVEGSNDRTTWRELAQRKEPFRQWDATFRPVTARYVRLRVPRRTTLHLERVSVRAN